jgi:hypothetical protein
LQKQLVLLAADGEKSGGAELFFALTSFNRDLFKGSRYRARIVGGCGSQWIETNYE